LIDGSDPEFPQIEESLVPVRQGVELVEQGKIIRSLIGSRLAHYIVPLSIARSIGDGVQWNIWLNAERRCCRHGCRGFS